MSIARLKQADNGVWQIHWNEGQRSRRQSTRETNEAAAQTVFGRWLLRERRSEAAPAACNVGAHWLHYMERHVKPNVASVASVNSMAKAFLPYFGKMAIADITQQKTDAYRERRVAAGVQPQSVRRELAQLFAALKFSAGFDTTALKLPADGQPRERWLSTAEIGRLLTAASARGGAVEMFVWLALETGGRETAIRELTWDRVDFEVNTIHLARPGRRVTKKRRASVPISAALRPVLEQAYARREAELVVSGHVEYGLTQVAAAANVPGVTPNVLRHTAASHMARKGVPIFLAAKVLGNSVAVVERVYARHATGDLQAAVDTISRGAFS